MLTLTEAREIVKRNVAASTTPALADLDIESILQETAWASVWAANTAYSEGAAVLPPTRNGALYVALQGGTSGTTSPFTAYAPYHISRVSDGTVVWEARIPAPAELYNVRRACYEAWLLKAAKASEYSAVSEDGQSFNDQQIYEHCLQMADRYRDVRVA